MVIPIVEDNTCIYHQSQGIQADGQLELSFLSVMLSIARKRHHDHSNYYKGKHFIWVGLPFQGLVHYFPLL